MGEVSAWPRSDPLDPETCQRTFRTGLLLTVATLGIYGLYWHYQTLDELHQRFDVGRFPMGAYVLMWIPVIGLIAYGIFMASYLDSLETARDSVGLDPGPGLGEHLAWTLAGALVLIGPPIAYRRLQTAINEVWEVLGEQAQEAEATDAEAPIVQV